MDAPVIFTPSNGLPQIIERQKAIELAKTWMAKAGIGTEPPYWAIAAIQEAAWIGKEN